MIKPNYNFGIFKKNVKWWIFMITVDVKMVLLFLFQKTLVILNTKPILTSCCLVRLACFCAEISWSTFFLLLHTYLNIRCIWNSETQRMKLLIHHFLSYPKTSLHFWHCTWMIN